MSLTPDDGLSPRERDKAWDPAVGTGDPTTAPHEEVAVAWLQRQPLVALALILALPAVGGVIEGLAAGQPIRATLIAGGWTLVATGLAFVRRVVTPLARPRNDHGEPLTPHGR